MIIKPILLEAFNSTSRYLDDLLNIDNPRFEGMVNQIYPPKLQLNKPYASDTEAPLLDIHMFLMALFQKNYDKRDDIYYDVLNFPFLDGDAPRRPSYGVFTFHSLLGLLEYAVMWQTFMLEIKV